MAYDEPTMRARDYDSVVDGKVAIAQVEEIRSLFAGLEKSARGTIMSGAMTDIRKEVEARLDKTEAAVRRANR